MELQIHRNICDLRLKEIISYSAAAHLNIFLYNSKINDLHNPNLYHVGNFGKS